MEDNPLMEAVKAKRGLSRAAKKRAKKKKKMETTTNDPATSETEAAPNTSLKQIEEPQQELETDECNELPELNKFTTICHVLENDSSLTSRQRARLSLQFLLSDTTTAPDFYANYWEKKPLHVRCNETKRFDGLLSLESIQKMVSDHELCYGRDLNVTRYEYASNGVKKRVTLDLLPDKNNNDAGNFVPVETTQLWKHYQEGCTVRLLCPHKHAASIHSLLSLLELEWGCMVGANAYLTPPGASQGFAPHYDDIEAFCLQLQGRKRWKVYKPLRKDEVLPRVSSEDYSEHDLRDVKPELDIVLEPGDMLYMPRGWIHQACTLPAEEGDNENSLHLTISVMQQWSWVDLMELLLPSAVESLATSELTTLREGLPPRFLDYMGTIHDNNDDNVPDVLRSSAAAAAGDDEQEKVEAQRIATIQERFRTEVRARLEKVTDEAMNILDAACDEISKRFLSDRLPPAWTRAEKKLLHDKDKEDIKILPNHLCRLARPGIARMTVEDGKAVLYHCVDNSCVYRETPLSPMEFELDDAPAIEQLLKTVEPHWICVADLIHDSVEDKVGVAQALLDEGILVLRPME